MVDYSYTVPYGRVVTYWKRDENFKKNRNIQRAFCSDCTPDNRYRRRAWPIPHHRLRRHRRPVPVVLLTAHQVQLLARDFRSSPSVMALTGSFGVIVASRTSLRRKHHARANKRAAEAAAQRHVYQAFHISRNANRSRGGAAPVRAWFIRETATVARPATPSQASTAFGALRGLIRSAQREPWAPCLR